MGAEVDGSGDGMSTTGPERPTAPDGSANVLLLAAPEGPDEGEACIELLTPTDPSTEHVLAVSLTQSADERVATWRDHAGGSAPARAGIITVGETVRAPSSEQGRVVSSGACETPITLEAIASPSDLDALEAEIEASLSGWAAGEETLVMCLHSVTALLRHNEFARVERFLRAITRAVTDADAIAHYHFELADQTEQSLYALEPLFDAVVAPDPDGAGGTAGVYAEELREAGFEEFRTRIGADESPSAAVVRALATIEGIDPARLDPPLYETVDPEALDSILAAPGATGFRVEFEVQGARVSVDEASVVVAAPIEP